MSRRHELEQRMRKLGEIGEIMRSMKNLALMETRKLARFLDVQGESVLLIEAAAEDFLQFHPQLALHTPPGKHALLVIGAERGFCGDFNEELLQSLVGCASPILGVGGKLCTRLEKHPALAGQFDGPTVGEDVLKTLNRLVPAIRHLQDAQDCQGLTVLHHRSGMEGIVRKSLLPPFTQNPASRPRHPPLLNLEPGQFFAELVHHYLFAALHEIFYTSRWRKTSTASSTSKVRSSGWKKKTRIWRENPGCCGKKKSPRKLKSFCSAWRGLCSGKSRGWMA